MKTLSRWGAVLAIFLLLAPAIGAEAAPPILIRNVTTDAPSYAQGATVNGTFELANPGPVAVANLTYVVRLVGGYGSTTLWTTEYQAETSEPFTLNAREAARIPFSLALPSALAGKDFGIEVQALYGNGLPLAWDDARIAISGTNRFVTVERAYVDISGMTFDAGEGPTLHEGQEGTMVAGVKNATTESALLTAVVAYKDREGNVLSETRGESIAFAPGEENDVVVPIGRAGLLPGVYTAEMHLADESGAQRSVSVTYRFIVGGGPLATITSASADTSVLHAGSTIAVEVSFAGSPPDLNPVGDPMPLPDKAVLSVKLFDESGKEVGNGSADVSLLAEKQKDVPITLSSGARAIRADISLTDASGELASLSVPLSRDYSDVAASSGTNFLGYGLLLVAALIGLLGVLVLIRARSLGAAPADPAAPRPFPKLGWMLIAAALLIGLLGASTFLLGGKKMTLVESAHAQWDFYYWYPDVDYGALCAYYPEYCGGAATATYATYVDGGRIWDEYIRRYLPQWTYASGYYYVKNVSIYNDTYRTANSRKVFSTLVTQDTYDAGKVYDASLPILSIASVDTIHHNSRGVDNSAVTKTLFDRIPAGGNTQSPVYHSTRGFLGSDVLAPTISINPIELPLAPGEEFYIEGTIAYQECLNIPAGFVIQGDFEGVEHTSTTDYDTNYQHVVLAASKRFSLGPYVAPTAPGTYRLDLGFGWSFNYTPLGNSREGYIDLTVDGPTAALSANPATVAPGNPSTLTSTCTDATSAAIDQGVGSVDATTDTSSVYPTATTAYTLTCTDANGVSATAQATVAVSSECSDGIDNDGDGRRDYAPSGGDPGCNDSGDNSESPDPAPPAPSGTSKAYIEANPGRVNTNASATLSWSAENVTSCTVTGTNGFSRTLAADASNQIATSSASSGAIPTQTTFTISCTPTASHIDIVNVVVETKEF
jgi:hypothetical protein